MKNIDQYSTNELLVSFFKGEVPSIDVIDYSIYISGLVKSDTIDFVSRALCYIIEGSAVKSNVAHDHHEPEDYNKVDRTHQYFFTGLYNIPIKFRKTIEEVKSEHLGFDGFISLLTDISQYNISCKTKYYTTSLTIDITDHLGVFLSLVYKDQPTIRKLDLDDFKNMVYDKRNLSEFHKHASIDKPVTKPKVEKDMDPIDTLIEALTYIRGKDLNSNGMRVSPVTLVYLIKDYLTANGLDINELKHATLNIDASSMLKLSNVLGNNFSVNDIITWLQELVEITLAASRFENKAFAGISIT